MWREPEPEQFNSRKDTFAKVTVKDLRKGVSVPRRVMPVLPVGERIKSFVEVEKGYTAEDMRHEVTRCLECGCVALFDCDLRRYATEYGVEVKRFLGEANQFQIDNTHPLIELDPNKCVLCGRCVRMCSEIVGVSAYGYINRGFNTVVMPAFGGSLLDTDCVSCGLCIGTCPTGAIVQKIPLAKPGPWKTTNVPTVCHYCGVGCTFELRRLRGHAREGLAGRGQPRHRRTPLREGAVRVRVRARAGAARRRGRSDLAGNRWTCPSARRSAMRRNACRS